MSLQEKNNHQSAALTTLVHVEEPTRGQQTENYAEHLTEAAHREEKDSSLCTGAADEEEESKEAKLMQMVNKLGHMPTLALNDQVSGDGVLRRPCENGEEGRDSSPDRNDSDSISAYEDASAETPEQDRIFPGENLELPDDQENNEGCETNSCQPSDPKNPELCVVS